MQIQLGWQNFDVRVNRRVEAGPRPFEADCRFAGFDAFLFSSVPSLGGCSTRAHCGGCPPDGDQTLSFGA